MERDFSMKETSVEPKLWFARVYKVIYERLVYELPIGENIIICVALSSVLSSCDFYLPNVLRLFCRNLSFGLLRSLVSEERLGRQSRFWPRRMASSFESLVPPMIFYRYSLLVTSRVSSCYFSCPPLSIRSLKKPNALLPFWEGRVNAPLFFVSIDSKNSWSPLTCSII